MMGRVRQQAFETLSLWEVGLRLHDFDPDLQDEKSIGPEVRETLRNLMQAAEGHFNLLDREGDELLATYRRIRRVVIDHPARKRLQSDAVSRVIEKGFLDALFILKDEFEKWRLINNQALPSFWFAEYEIEEGRKERIEIFGEQAVEAGTASEKPGTAIEHPPESALHEASEQGQTEGKGVEDEESLQRKAARNRHAERNAICERFCLSLRLWPLVKSELDREAIRDYNDLTEPERVELARSRPEYVKASADKRKA